MKKIGIGYENYKEFIDQDMYYVDKTLLIRDVIEKGGKVTLFTRPRRFGKTLALSMLRTFFECEYDYNGNIVDNRRYFGGKKIMEAGDDILSRMGKYPVVNLSLKSAKQPDFYGSFIQLRDSVISEFGRHDYLSNSDKLTDEERKNFNQLLNGRSEWTEKSLHFDSKEEEREELRKEQSKYAAALQILSGYLKKHHGTNVVILLDEYDVPLENAYHKGFYEEMVGFVRSLFESALKTNDALEQAVVTGCLRISKESIFTGLNNLKINSIQDDDFAEDFGFTQTETEEMLNVYGLAEKFEEAKDWYDGYLFGETEIYNPWSITSYVDGVVNGGHRFPKPYWSNTSSNSVIRDFVYNNDESVREELDALISGGTIEKKIHDDITYDDIHESEDNLWNFLFFTGYMRKISERQVDDDIYVTMCIPNREIRSIYSNHIRKWFDDIVKKTDITPMHEAILNRDTDRIANYVSDLLEQCISTFDSAEGFYHGFFLSILYGIPRYSVKSNRESGIGRPDIILYPNRPGIPAYIFECKSCKDFSGMKTGLQEAFNQIRDRKYVDGLHNEGYDEVIAYGICFCKKSCIAGLYSG